MAQLSYTYTAYGWWTADVVINCSITYDEATNSSTVVFQESYVHYRGRKGYGSSSVDYITVSAGDNPSSSGGASFSTAGNSKPEGVYYYATPAPSVTVQHSAGPGAKTVTLSGSTTISVYPNENYSKMQNFTGSGSTTVTVHTIPYASVIAGATNPARTNSAFSLVMTRYSASYWHRASFTCGGRTLYTSPAFETSLGFTVPRSWFDAFPNTASLSVALSVQTYADSACTSPVGSPATATVTVTADAGMAPVIGAGFASAAANNAGTAAAAIGGYVQGYSRARITLTKSALTLANNAAAARYTVSCQGTAQSVASPGAAATVDTAVLTGASPITISVTVTDSRGFTASTTLTVTPMAYAAPTISGVSVFRCGSGGAADEDGNRISAKATANCSSLGGQNSVTLDARAKTVSASSYGSPTAMTSGEAKVLDGLFDPDLSYIVLLTETDALGNAGTASVTLPTRFWALKFRPDAQGAAFGKAPESSKALELPADWTLRIGAESFLEKVYPVGSIYMSVSSTSPASLFGGTWERIQNRFLLAAGSSYAAGATGGEAAVTLTVDQMPAHKHNILGEFGATGVSTFQPWTSYTQLAGVNAGSKVPSDVAVESTGGGQAHNNMPPYLAVYMWKRIA